MKAYTEDQMRQRIIFERADYREIMEMWPCSETEVQSVEEKVVDLDVGCPTRFLIYYPLGAPKGNLPVFMVMHGGGWIRGRADYDDRFCRKTANEAGCVVVNVDYKLAPEFKFPTPINECYALFLWLREHAQELGIDADRIAIGGHSAGGALAAAVCHRLRDEGLPMPLCQVLDYPSVQVDMIPEFNGFSEGITLTAMERNFLFIECYFTSREETKHPYASPLLAQSFADLPPALMVIAGNDILRPTQEAYAKRLADAGVPIETQVFEGCQHGFTVWPNMSTPAAHDAAWERINSYLKKMFENP